MRHIRKGEEPERFRSWKERANADWQPSWGDLRREEKPDLHHRLLAEQGWLCCYCTERVTEDSSHIEHLKPRADFPELALDYGNLLACCEGGSKDAPPRQTHCDQRKGSWYDEELFISPLDEDCEGAFRYTARGEILPSPEHPRQSAATETIRRLNLGCAKLERGRGAAVGGALAGLDELAGEELRTFYLGLQTPNRNGELEPFLPAILHVLAGLIPPT